MNEKYKIEVTFPLIRFGLKISTEVSRKYLLPALEYLMSQVREFNLKEKDRPRSIK